MADTGIPIYNIEDFYLENELKNLLVGQKRTSINKPFVLLDQEEGLVFKGPYTENRYNNIIERTEIFKRWKTPLVVLPEFVFEAPARKGDKKMDKYIAFPNLMKDLKLSGEEYTEKSGKYTYKVVKRTTVMRLKDALDEKKYELSMDEATELIFALCQCYILAVHDMGLGNMLVNIKKKKIYIIDFDDTIAKARDDDPVFYFCKIGKDYKWYETYGCQYKAIAERLEKEIKGFITDKSLEIRYEKCISLLKKYHSPRKICLGVGGVDFKAMRTTLTPKDEDKSMEGKRVYNEPSNSKGITGYKKDILISAVQKYIRRAEVEKALIAGFDLYNFKHVEGGKGIFTNLINRLKVIACEDIGMGNMNLVVNIVDLLNDPDFLEPEDIMVVIEKLSASKKSRRGSHAWRAYCTPEGNKMIKELNNNINEQRDGFNGLQHLNLDHRKDTSQLRDEDLIKCSDKDDIILVEYLTMIDKRLREKDENALFWIYVFVDDILKEDFPLSKKFKNPFDKKSKGFSKPSSNPFGHIWEILAKHGDKKLLAPLCTAFYDCYERNAAKSKKKGFLCDEKIFLSAAVHCIIFDVKYKDLKLMEIEPKNMKKLKDYIDPNYKLTLKIDDYVIDKHTGEGKRKGANINDFVNEGSIVYPEDMDYHDDRLVWVYSQRN